MDRMHGHEPCGAGSIPVGGTKIKLFYGVTVAQIPLEDRV